MMLYFMVLQSFMSYFFKGTPSNEVGQISANGTRPISPQTLFNYLAPGQKFDFDVYLSFKDNYQFFERGGISERQPVWEEQGLTYDYAATNNREINLTLPVYDKLRKNNTLYLHFQIKTLNPFYREEKNTTSLLSLDDESEQYSTQLNVRATP